MDGVFLDGVVVSRWNVVPFVTTKVEEYEVQPMYLLYCHHSWGATRRPDGLSRACVSMALSIVILSLLHTSGEFQKGATGCAL